MRRAFSGIKGLSQVIWDLYGAVKGFLNALLRVVIFIHVSSVGIRAYVGLHIGL